MTLTSTLPLKSPMVRTHPSPVAQPSFLSLFASILFPLQRLLQQTGRTNHHIQRSGQQSQIQMTSRCPSTLSAPGQSACSGPFSYPASINFSTYVIPVSPLAQSVLPSPHIPELSTNPCLCPIFVQLVAQLLSFPLGRAWSRFMPYVTIFGIPLNPGPFTVKEHVVITVMATVGSTSAYAVRIPFPRTSPTQGRAI